MKKLSLLLGFAALLTSVGCGSGDGHFGNPGPGGNFSNSSLNGQYAYALSGFDFTSSNSGIQFHDAGVFTADGNGHITDGWNDLGESTNVVSAPITGTYSVDADGTGNATFNFSGSTITLALTVVSSSKVYLTTLGFGGASNATGAGVAEKQTPSVFTAAPAGTFAFRLHTLGTIQGSSSIVGAFNITGGVVGTGNEDILRGGTLDSETLTGSFNAPDGISGRGTAALTTGLGATSSFFYYLIDGSTFLLFSNDIGSPGLGRAEKQSSTSFSSSSLSGSYAFGSRGDTGFILGSRTVGRFTADGSGAISAGAFDSVQDGTPFSNVAFTGTYTALANGRAVVNLTPSSGPAIQQILWLVSPSRAFFLINDAAKFEDGTIDLQQSSPFSNSSLNTKFAFLTDGFDSIGDFNQVGTLSADGSGNLTLRYLLSAPLTNSQVLTPTGTYSVASNGRTTASVNNLSNNLVFYLISGNDAYILQNDTNTEVDGVMSKQQ
jgi:hypothetical protein